MKDSSYLSGQFGGLHFQKRMSIHKQIAFNFTRVKMWNKSIEGTNQRCLAAATSPGQKNKLAGPYSHVNAAEGKIFAFFITKAEILE